MSSSLKDLLGTAIENRASDLHLRENSPVQLRIDRKLVEVDFVADKKFYDTIIREIVPASHLDRFEQTGDLDFAWEEPEVGRFRVNLHKQRGKRGMTMRHVRSDTPRVADVNLPPILNTIAEAHNGIIFVAGTTGSGKSTTMAAMLEHINETMTKHIITLEDPIEFTFTDKQSFFEQREIGLDAISFESALHHALRQDPDVIVLGEMRDRKTFETAMVAAETGHLVITTLHTKDAPQSISRILDMFPVEERESIRKSLAGLLRAIICQRLVPKSLGDGVIPITEILIATPIVRKLIFEGKLEKLGMTIEAGAEDGMMTFNSCLLQRVNESMISEETALAVSDNPQALKMNLNGIFLSADGGIIQ